MSFSVRLSLNSLSKDLHIVRHVFNLRRSETSFLHLLVLPLEELIHVECKIVDMRVSWVVKIWIVPNLPDISSELSRWMIHVLLQISLDCWEVIWISDDGKIVLTTLSYWVDWIEEWKCGFLFLQWMEEIEALLGVFWVHPARFNEIVRNRRDWLFLWNTRRRQQSILLNIHININVLGCRFCSCCWAFAIWLALYVR